MAILLLEEALQLYHAIGICLIGIGIYFSTFLGRQTNANR